MPEGESLAARLWGGHGCPCFLRKEAGRDEHARLPAVIGVTLSFKPGDALRNPADLILNSGQDILQTLHVPGMALALARGGSVPSAFFVCCAPVSNMAGRRSSFP